jgi:hypothetical protein
VCADIETIDVPWEWHDVNLYAGNFCEIEASVGGSVKRRLGDGRWRFGRDLELMGREGKRAGIRRTRSGMRRMGMRCTS